MKMRARLSKARGVHARYLLWVVSQSCKRVPARVEWHLYTLDTLRAYASQRVRIAACAHRKRDVSYLKRDVETLDRLPSHMRTQATQGTPAAPAKR